MITVLAVAAGAAVGAPLRYLVDRAVNSRHDSIFAWGTLTVNLVGSFVLGLVTAVSLGSGWSALLGTGLCGALTTYSTLSYETLRMVESGATGMGVANVMVSVVVGLAAAAAGLALGGHAFWP